MYTFTSRGADIHVIPVFGWIKTKIADALLLYTTCGVYCELHILSRRGAIHPHSTTLRVDKTKIAGALPLQSGGRVRVRVGPVSYTHLTLPTKA